VIVILYQVIEEDREHRWVEIIPYLFLLTVLLKDHFVLLSTGFTPAESLFGVGVFVFLDGFLVLCMAFLLARLRDGALSRSVIYWIYLFFGALIMWSSQY
jgi:threonine/homoserine/homoserine lactone efflux protein